jgi:hypothetical protein
MNFVIYSPDEKLFWNNDDGWCNLHTATIFEPCDVTYRHLPLGGYWVQKGIAGVLPTEE